MAVKKKEKLLELDEKDVKDLIMLCQLAKQIINKYDEPAIVTALWLAFTTDMVTPEGTKVSEISDTEVKVSFTNYLSKVMERVFKE